MSILSLKNEPSCKVLLVEDEAIVRMVHNRMLSDLGVSVECAENGATAIQMAKNDYDCILMDIGLPDTDGIEVTKKIRAYERENHCKRKKIIALTAYRKEEVQESCTQAGMDGVLNKPVTSEELNRAIKKLA